MSKKLTVKEFIQKAEKIHGRKYDYSRVVYHSAKVKITIMCKKHGEFLQRPDAHLNNQGCPKCGIIKSSTKQRLGKNKLIKSAGYNLIVKWGN